MDLGVFLGYWGAGYPEGIVDRLKTAVALGYSSAWTSEAYGSDALTPIASYSRAVPELRWGTAVAQISARAPTCTATSAMTLDHLTGGQFSLGLGVSGPQVVEGWFGQPFAQPLERMHEYLTIVRQTTAREQPVRFQGKYYELPLEGGTGLGKPLKSILKPIRNLPILIGAEGPKNVALAGEIADGWIAWMFSPAVQDFYLEALDRGFSRPGARNTRDSFQVVAVVPAAVSEDVDEAASGIREQIALYVGGMGSREQNFHRNAVARLGFEAEVLEIRNKYMAGDRAGAVAAVPLDMVDKLALIGPPARIKDTLAMWKESCVTTLVVQGALPALDAVASAM
jgi:F420-dependent oxidoreductase-like protein